MGMFTERDEDFTYGGSPKFGVPAPRSLRGSSTAAQRYTFGDSIGGVGIPREENIPYKDATPSYWYLEGYHRVSGEWVKLARFGTIEAADAAIMACHSKTQPASKKVSIVWEDFSAFRANSHFTI